MDDGMGGVAISENMVVEMGTKSDAGLGVPVGDGMGGVALGEDMMADKLFDISSIVLDEGLKMIMLANIMAITLMSVEKKNKQMTGDLIMVQSACVWGR